MTEPSFSQKVRTELSQIANTEKHCRAAARAAAGVFTSGTKADKIEHVTLKRRCCRRAFLREAFLCAGSINDPQKEYHLEWHVADEERAKTLKEVLKSFGIGAQMSRRGRHCVLYLKDGAQIALTLNVMGAHVSLMEMENSRILKEMRSDVNRRVNCDAANIARTVDAASAQMQAIRHLEESGQLKKLPKSLREAARARQKHPEATIAELAASMTPPLTKSGMNHRLQKLVAIGTQQKGVT